MWETTTDNACFVLCNSTGDQQWIITEYMSTIST